MELNEQQRELFQMIRTDMSARDFFFSKVESPKFFYPLKNQKYFDHDTIPDPIPVAGGYHLPFWSPLTYLQKLSLAFARGEAHDLIGPVLEIIQDVSEKISERPEKNWRIFYSFINILANVPNDRISSEYLKTNIGFWLKYEDNYFINPEITQKLVPKFLTDHANPDDIKKAEFILKSLLSARLYLPTGTDEKTDRWDRQIYWMDEVLTTDDIINKIAKNLSTDFVFFLAEQLKIFVRASLRIRENLINHDGKEYRYKLVIVMTDIRIQAIIDGVKKQGKLIVNFDAQDDFDLTATVVENLVHDLGFPNTEGLFEEIHNIIKGLDYDLSSIWAPSLEDLTEKSHQGNLTESFTVYILLLAGKICEISTEKGTGIVKTFLSGKYKVPLFKRLAINLIGKNWNNYKNIFWSLTSGKDKNKLLNDSSINHEVYSLLKNNISKFTAEERIQIKVLIDEGPDLEAGEPDNTDYWTLRWVSAMKEDEFFRETYLMLSEKLSLTSTNFENEGKVQIRSGDESPFSATEMLAMSIDKLITELKGFKRDIWNGPSVIGFARTLEEAITQQPAQFVDQFSKFLHVPYVYVYHLLSGLTKAWKAKQNFNWTRVFDFIQAYRADIDYIADSLKTEGDWDIDKSIVEGEIGHLIEEGCRSDSWAFDIALMPTAEKILTEIISHLGPTDLSRQKESGMDYPTFSINTTAGKVYRALLDCALRNKRILKNDDNWQSIEKPLFDQGLMKSNLEIYVFFGMYFRQFAYLDNNWLTNQIQALNGATHQWKAFMGGYLFIGPLNNKKTFNLMKPNYILAIEKKFTPESIGSFTNGLTTHLGCYYLWEYEELTDGSVIKKYIDESPAKTIGDLIHFFRIQRDDVQKLTEPKREVFQKKIAAFWEYILRKLDESTDPETHKLVAELPDLIIYFTNLDDHLYRLIAPSLKYFKSDHSGFFFFSHLVKILKDYNSVLNATIVGKLLDELVRHNIPYFQEKDIAFIVEKIYSHPSTKSFADEICIEYFKAQQFFLRPLYEKHNPVSSS